MYASGIVSVVQCTSSYPTDYILLHMKFWEENFHCKSKRVGARSFYASAVWYYSAMFVDSSRNCTDGVGIFMNHDLSSFKPGPTTHI